MRPLIISIISIGFLFFCHALTALPKVYSHTPIQITSDTVSFEQREHQAIYEGNVILIQGNHELHADKLITAHHSKGHIHAITAIGKPATFVGRFDQRPSLHAKANTIHYSPITKLLVLEGAATLKQEEDIFQGPTLSYHLEKEVISATRTKEERPTLIFHPRN